jgi:hypothetical protein
MFWSKRPVGKSIVINSISFVLDAVAAGGHVAHACSTTQRAADHAAQARCCPNRVIGVGRCDNRQLHPVAVLAVLPSGRQLCCACCQGWLPHGGLQPQQASQRLSNCLLQEACGQQRRRRPAPSRADEDLGVFREA